MLCQHLPELEQAILAAGIVETYRGQTWTTKCRRWVCFDACLDAAFAMFAAWYNFVWRTRKPGTTSKRRPTAAMMAGLTDHLCSPMNFSTR